MRKPYDLDTKQIGPMMSECLVTGFHRKDGAVILAVPDDEVHIEGRCWSKTCRWDSSVLSPGLKDITFISGAKPVMPEPYPCNCAKVPWWPPQNISVGKINTTAITTIWWASSESLPLAPNSVNVIPAHVNPTVELRSPKSRLVRLRGQPGRIFPEN